MTHSRFLHFLAPAVLLLLTAAPADARVISFPIRLDNAFVRQLLVRELFNRPDESARVWQDESECNEIVLSEPKVVGRDGKLHVIARFDAKLGAGIGSWCLNVTDWNGILDAAMEPQLHPSLPIVTFRVVDSDMYGTDGAKHFTGTLWDWVKSRIHPRLETIRIDLYRPINELEMFLPVLFPGTDIERTQKLLDSLTLTSVTVDPETIDVRVEIDVPEPAPTTPAHPLPEPTLTASEVERWDKAWQSWDGFLTFLIKHSSREASEQLRHDLREVFLEARYDIIGILRPSEKRASEPVRPLFLRTWKRLAPILRQLTTDLPGEEALRYMSFITAADALSALEQLGPEYGVEITSDGLRRLARMIEPAPFGDPVSYDEAVDPELRKLFGFGAPPPTPVQEDEKLEEEETEEETATPAPVVSPTPDLEARNPKSETDARSETPKLESSVFAAARSLFRISSFEFVSDFGLRLANFPAPVWADEPRKLERWIPTRDDVLEYLPRVRELLLATSQKTQTEKNLEARYSTLYRNMMLATAWQESCWRQFVRKGGQLQTLTSPAGAVGIMQVNVRVWRGFYDQNALRTSMKYNAEAGSEILHHYFVDYAIAKGEHTVRNSVDDLARATYAAYNGGPAKLRRYRRAAGGKGGHRIDEAFWKKYRQIKAGNELAVAACFGVTPTS